MILTIEGLLAVLSFGLTCFSIGYMLGQSKNDRPDQGHGHSYLT